MNEHWTHNAWEAINQLAELDREHYRGHIHDPEAFLATARARRIRNHQALIDTLLRTNPHMSTNVIVAACNPKAAPETQRRDYLHRRPNCDTCRGLSLIPIVDDGVERWMRCPACNTRQGAA